MDKSVSKNIGINFIGRIWLAVVGIVFVPLYIYYLGIESYGLVGFYTTILASIQILDFGLSTTLNRELSRAISEKRAPASIRSLVFTLETFYVGFGFLIGLIIYLVAPILAEHWVNSETIPVPVIKESIQLMGLVIAFQWPLSLYRGGLLGLEKQVTYNVIAIIFSTLRGAGVVLALKFIEPTLFVFFVWQAVISFFYVFSTRMSLWAYLPKASGFPVFSINELSSIWKFAIGMTGIGIVSILLTTVDKILLSKLLSLSDFGYYMLAFTLTKCITTASSPIGTAIFPRFSALVASNQLTSLKKLYHQSCRLMAVAVFSIGVFVISFAYQIMLIWTGDTVTADKTYQLVMVLILGSVFNALLVVPYLLTLAYGWTKLTIYQNSIAAIFLVPLLFYWVELYGSLGASFVWLALNVGPFLIIIPIVHKRLLKGELHKVYLIDYGIPFLIVFAVILLIKTTSIYFFPIDNLIYLVLIFSLYLLIIALLVPEIRKMLKTISRKLILKQ